MANRKIGSHQLNMESSRSHSIATVYCETGGGETGKIPCFGKVRTPVLRSSLLNLF